MPVSKTTVKTVPTGINDLNETAKFRKVGNDLKFEFMGGSLETSQEVTLDEVRADEPALTDDDVTGFRRVLRAARVLAHKRDGYV